MLEISRFRKSKRSASFFYGRLEWAQPGMEWSKDNKYSCENRRFSMVALYLATRSGDRDMMKALVRRGLWTIVSVSGVIFKMQSNF
jgi:hypothetical protein